MTNGLREDSEGLPGEMNSFHHFLNRLTVKEINWRR